MQPEDFQSRYNVSRETMARLVTYYTLLLKWQRAINLVSPGTLDNIWQRHFADSAQMLTIIKEGRVADLGSGAGFPGLVLAIMNPQLDIHLIESDERKCQFLKNVSRETKTSVTIHTNRIEEVLPHLSPDIITARALAPLEDLLAYCLPCAQENPQLCMVFLKGRKAEGEIAAAREKFDFENCFRPSETDPDGAVLEIAGLKMLDRKS